MKRLCYASILKVLYRNKAVTVAQRKINGAFLLLLDDSVDCSDDGTLATKMGNGSRDIDPDIASRATSMTPDSITDIVRTTIIKKIDPSKVEPSLLALLDILKDDKDITNETVFCDSPTITKKDILAMKTIDPAWLVSVLFIYAVAYRKSADYKDEIKEIDNTYIDSFIAKQGTISLKKEIETLTPHITKTLNDHSFNHVFTEVSHTASIQISNPHDLKIFHLNVSNCQFSDRELKQFLLTNVGRYVYSRAEMERFKIDDALETVGYKAIQKLKEKGSDDALESGAALGDMLLYAFLEKILDAPKLFSKIEFTMHSGQHATKSDGIHLLAIDDGTGSPCYQLVFGASDIITDLKSAVDHALDCAVDIAADPSGELALVESTAYGLSFDDQTLQYLRELILPNKNTVSNMDQAFGMFIGYSIDIDPTGMSNDAFRKEVTKKLAADAAMIAPYITAGISSRKLDHYSFYFYLLPFNNADDDKKQIFTDILTGGAI